MSVARRAPKAVKVQCACIACATGRPERRPVGNPGCHYFALLVCVFVFVCSFVVVVVVLLLLCVFRWVFVIVVVVLLLFCLLVCLRGRAHAYAFVRVCVRTEWTEQYS